MCSAERSPQADFRGTLASTYDAAGRLTASTDRLGRVTSYAYDALDRPTRVTAPDPDGNPATSNIPVWAFAYDAAGQQRLAIDPAGARTATAYDDAGAVALVRDPVGSATRFARDAVGNLIRVTDPLGNTTTTTFDALDRPVREQVGFTAADRTFAYDAAGNLDRVKDRNGRVIDFDSDNLGRTVAEKWLPAGGTTPIRTLTSTYTATGQLQGVVDSDTADSSFTYDALDRPVTETTSLHGPAAPSTPFTFTLTSTYDAADRRTGLADSRGGLSTYGYDGAGRMTSASLGTGGVAGPAVTLGYDANDRLTDIGRRVGTAGRSILSRLNYDAAGRLTRIEHADSADTAWGGDTPLASFEDTLDAAGRVTSTIGTSRTGAQETRSYGYDAAGQIVSQAVTGQATTAFAYDAAGNRTAGTTIQPGNRLAEDATYRYVYDAEGNLTRREEKASTRVREYAWDQRNRLTSVTDRDTAGGPATQQVSFVYDAFDRRVGKIVDPDGAGPQAATKRWTMYDGQDAYADLDGAGVVQSRYLHGPAVDLLLARLDADTTSTWYPPDRLSSTLAARVLLRIDVTGKLVQVRKVGRDVVDVSYLFARANDLSSPPTDGGASRPRVIAIP